MAVTISDVAKAAGVSTATVSRVINNSSSITLATREKTLAIMKELNYVPNSLARGLSNQKSLNVTLLINIADAKSFSNPFFYEVMHGIETVVYERGLSLTITSSKKTISTLDTLEQMVNGKKMQGLIIPSSLANKKIVSKFRKMNFPFVIIGELAGYSEPLNWVDINNKQGGEQAVEHLIKKGYRDIAFIGGRHEELFNRNRLSGYMEALKRNSLTINQDYIKECDNTKTGAYEKMSELLSLNDRPDAVICGDNIISFGAIKAINGVGLNIPKDLGVVTFDNYPLAELIEPSLTAVDIDVFELGVVAANTLLKMIDNPDVRQQQSLISTRIDERESTMKNKTL